MPNYFALAQFTRANETWFVPARYVKYIITVICVKIGDGVGNSQNGVVGAGRKAHAWDGRRVLALRSAQDLYSSQTYTTRPRHEVSPILQAPLHFLVGLDREARA